MSEGETTRYLSGGWNAVCYECGRKFKASELRRHWQGYYVCPEHWEPRQPQDFVRAVKDIQTVPWAQPPEDVFVSTNWDLNWNNNGTDDGPGAIFVSAEFRKHIYLRWVLGYNWALDRTGTTNGILTNGPPEENGGKVVDQRYSDVEFTDSFTLGGGWNPWQDKITINSQLTLYKNATDLMFVDSIKVKPEWAATDTKHQNDYPTLNDQWSFHITTRWDEEVKINELLTWAGTLPTWRDGVGIGDKISFDAQLPEFSDHGNITESFTIEVTKSLVDTFGITESFTVGVTKHLGDAFGISDSFTYTVTRAPVTPTSSPLINGGAINSTTIN